MKGIARSGRKGATLLEILIVIAIVTVLATLSLQEGGIFRKRSGLSRAVSDTVTTLRLARSHTVSSTGLSSWGVYLEPDKIILFQGLNFNGASPTNSVVTLPDTIAASFSLANSTDSVVFLRPKGNTANHGIVTLALKDGSDSRFIRIDEAGAISVDTQPPPSVPLPQYDARHIHVQLGWDIRTNSILRLVFHDPPSPDVNDDVAVATCMDVTNSVFDCTRTVMIGGQSQTVRVSTHSLSANTVLNINRDRRENTKAMEVWFDGVQIVSFDVAGAVTKGPDVLVGAPAIQ